MVVQDTFEGRVEDTQNDDTEETDSAHRTGTGNGNITESFETKSETDQESECEESEAEDLSR